MSKKFYESGNIFLNVDKRLTKNRCLNIVSSGDCNITSKLKLSVNKININRKLEKDAINGKNVLMLDVMRKIDYKFSKYKRDKNAFFEENKVDILNVLRIARQYAKDNGMSLYVEDEATCIPETEFSECVLDKETNTVYPILYDELKETSRLNIPISFQIRGFIQKNNFSFPDNLKAEIDLKHSSNSVTILLRDEHKNLSYDMSNVKIIGSNDRRTFYINYKNRLQRNNQIKRKKCPVDIVSLPKECSNSIFQYQICSENFLAFKNYNFDKKQGISTKGRSSSMSSHEDVSIYTAKFDMLKKFFFNNESLKKYEKDELRKAFIFMKENNLNIIEQSRILLNYIHKDKAVIDEKFENKVNDFLYNENKGISLSQ